MLVRGIIVGFGLSKEFVDHDVKNTIFPDAGGLEPITADIE